MSGNVVFLHGQPQPVLHFLRLGSSNYHQVEALMASGRLPSFDVVVEAGVYARQAELVRSLQNAGRKVILDLNVAELSEVGKWRGAASGAPWADPEGILEQRHFDSGAGSYDLIGQIARFVVRSGVLAVMAPARLLTGVTDRRFGADVDACCNLRSMLDRLGGDRVKIYYPLIMPSKSFNDIAERRAIIAGLNSAPVDQLWLRVSHFGADATPVGIRKFISSAHDFASLRIPIIGDHVGGMAGIASAAFGAITGIAHGVLRKERFDASSWPKPPRPTSGGGGGYTVLLPGLDRLLKVADATALIEAAGGRRCLSCNDPQCCKHGFEDTLRNPAGHYLYQRSRQIQALSVIPELLRPKHFLERQIDAAERTARSASRLDVGDDLKKLTRSNLQRLSRLREVLEDLHETVSANPGSPGWPPESRQRSAKNPRKV